MAFKLLRISNNFRTLSQRFKASHHADFQAALSSIPPTELSVTDNNVKVASQNINGQTATVGVWINAGSRFEETHNNGTANLINHLVFKGSAKRTQQALESEVAGIGGRLHSFTSREKTAFYGTCLSKDVPKLVDILSDAIFNPKFSEEELCKVRNQLLYESSEFEANIEDVIFDYLHAAAYQDTPLAQSVIGTQKNIQSLTPNDLKNYIDTHYKASSIVVAGAGNIQHNELLQLAEKHFGKIEDSFDREPPNLPRCRYTGSEVRLRDDSLPFPYFAIALEGPGNKSKDRLPLLITTEALGSYDRSEGYLGPHEICHSYNAFNLAYSDTGLFGVYAVCDPLQCEDMVKSTLDSLHRVSYGITDAELDEAKNRLITKYLVNVNGSKRNCEDIGNSLISYGRRIPLNELIPSILNVPNETIRSVTEKYVNNKCPVVSAVGPIENLTDYVNIRTRMYWARV